MVGENKTALQISISNDMYKLLDGYSKEVTQRFGAKGFTKSYVIELALTLYFDFMSGKVIVSYKDELSKKEEIKDDNNRIN